MDSKNEPAQSLTHGIAVIEAFVKTLPATPGVYRMLGDKGQALYVGKAKDLSRRVRAYTQPHKLPVRLQRMIALTVAMEFSPARSEADALLIEANLIKKLKPRYNILLRDDKSFPYILITGDHDFPQVTKHRGARDARGEYFGPFASGRAVNDTIAILQKAFLLRTCTDHVFANRTRPCLQYQIRRCTAPCVGKVSARDYSEQVGKARDFLTGKSDRIKAAFIAEMTQASDAREYERAAAFRDRIRALSSIEVEGALRVRNLDDADIFALAGDGRNSCVQVFFFRSGQNFGNHPYFLSHEDGEDPASVLSSFIAQFYANKLVPKKILLSHALPDRALLAQAMGLKAGYKISLEEPKQGDKKKLMDHAIKTAVDALKRRKESMASGRALFEQLAEIFDLDGAPEKVEVYDNSHISGTNAIGAMIVAGPDGFIKNAYRKFNIKGAVTPGDDYAMMREMLSRRFKNADAATLPELVLIDGGAGQLAVAQSVLHDLGLHDLPVAAIAKGPERNAGKERFFIPDKAPFSLDRDAPVLHLLQRLRDEAHRFAINTHRSMRAKALVSSPLDAVPGIGPGRKKALLQHFGSGEAVKTADLESLEKVPGISKAVAKKIHGFFNEA